MAKGDWYGSFVDEIYDNGPYETQDKAVDGMLCQSVEQCGEAEGFNIGQAEPVEPQCVEGRHVIECAEEAAAEDAREAAEGWLTNVSNEQTKELTEALAVTFKAWLAKHKLEPTFFQIDNVVSISRDDERVVAHFIKCEPCKKKRAEYAAGMQKANAEIQKIIDEPKQEQGGK